MGIRHLALTLTATKPKFLLLSKLSLDVSKKQIGAVGPSKSYPQPLCLREGDHHGCQIQPCIPSSLAGGAPDLTVCDPVDSPSTLRLSVWISTRDPPCLQTESSCHAFVYQSVANGPTELIINIRYFFFKSFLECWTIPT